MDHRKVVDGVLWRTRSGSAWRDLPPEYGNWKPQLKCPRHTVLRLYWTLPGTGDPALFYPLSFSSSSLTNCSGTCTATTSPRTVITPFTTIHSSITTLRPFTPFTFARISSTCPIGVGLR